MRCVALALWVVWLAPAAVSAQDTPSSDEEAHQLFGAGRVAYDDGRYDEALTHFQAAYQLSGRPELLYNVGQCFDRLRRDAEALDAFERYLAALPEAPNRAEVEQRIAALRSATAGATGGEPATGGGADTLAPWIVTLSGAAVLVIGVGLLIAGGLDRATVESAPTGTTWASVEGAYGRAEPLTIAGAVLLVTGAVAGGAGVAWLVLASGPGGETRAGLGPSGLVVAGTF